MQFAEYLSMDRYKHSSSTQRSQRTRCAPRAIKADNVDDSTERPTANGTGVLNKSVVSNIDALYFAFYHPAVVVFSFPDAEHLNNNKPFSNGSCPSVFLHSPGVNPQLGLTYDYR